MKIGSYNSKNVGRVDVDLQKLDAAFRIYKKEYSEILGLSSKQIDSLRKFKMKTGGDLIEFKSAGKTLALVTLRNVNRNCKELGDVMKFGSIFSRADFAEGLHLASTYFADKGCCIVGYPNKYALPMELEAGYQVLKTYDKVNYLVVMGFGFLVPVVRDRKLQLKFKKCKGAHLVLFGLALRKTRLRIKGLRVFAMSNSSFKIGNIFYFGVLYKYVINDHDNGSPIIFFGDCKPDKVPLGYEYSDNSA